MRHFFWGGLQILFLATLGCSDPLPLSRSRSLRLEAREHHLWQLWEHETHWFRSSPWHQVLRNQRIQKMFRNLRLHGSWGPLVSHLWHLTSRPFLACRDPVHHGLWLSSILTGSWGGHALSADAKRLGSVPPFYEIAQLSLFRFWGLYSQAAW